MIGYHGETRGTISGPFQGPEVYLSYTPDLAESYGDASGVVHAVQFDASNPLNLDTPQAFVDAWESSGAEHVDGPFHPAKTSVFCQWARDKDHDAILIPDSAFDGDLGYEMVAGTIGEPQIILLYPHLARVLTPSTS